MQKRSAHPRTHLRARGHIVGAHGVHHTHRHASTHASKHTHEKNTHGTGKNKEALVEGLVEKADFTILKKSCIPVELTRTAIWELDGSESSAAWDALDRMKKGEIVEWLMGGSQPTDGVRGHSCIACLTCGENSLPVVLNILNLSQIGQDRFDLRCALL
jgi:hypothetical protein